MENDENIIAVHPLSNNPTEAWDELSKTQKCRFLEKTDLIKPDEDQDYIRVVCMSDTHSENDKFKFTVPDGDIFIHAGDFSRWGEESELLQFNDWIKSLPHRYKIVIAGNREISFDGDCIVYGGHLRKQYVEERKKTLKDCIYLQDSSITVHALKIHGSPWQPEYGGLAFNIPRGEKILGKWNLIPDDTDILVTHGPPLGYGDRAHSGVRTGCVELLSTVQKRVKPKYHIFGHIHEDYGISTDGTTVFINAATCNRSYLPVNLPIVFDIKGTRSETEKRNISSFLDVNSEERAIPSFSQKMRFWAAKSAQNSGLGT